MMNKKKRKYVVIHCTATPEGREVTVDDIRRWHLSPKPQGRGWKQVGYSELIMRNGDIKNMVQWDYDQYVDNWEITNGVAGLNDVCLHVVYAGGCDKQMNPKNTMTPKQEQSLLILVGSFLSLWQDIQFAGHNQFAAKACPSFDVPELLKKWGIPERNIYK